MSEQPSIVNVEARAGYVDWCAIGAGAMTATAISIVLFTFGTAIGLSMISPYEGEGVSRAAYFATLALWTLWVVVSSFMAGGYVAGRLRRRVGDATEHEVDVRDGAHGLLVWATGVVFAALLLMLGVSGVIGTAAIATSASSDTNVSDSANGVTAFTVDALLRTSADSAPPSTTSLTEATEIRNELARLLTYGMTNGELAADDKDYAARVISRHTGMTSSEAATRIDTVLAKAKETADAARKITLLIGFLTAAALLVGAASAAWAANLGGRHRDRNTDTTAFWRWA